MDRDSRQQLPLILALAALQFLAACASKPTPLALTRVEADRMDVILLPPPGTSDDPSKDLKTLPPFSFEPLWNSPRTRLAFTRINLRSEGERLLTLYNSAGENYLDIVSMGQKDWNGYGFAPAWHPSGRALAFKMRSSTDSGVYAAILDQQRTNKLLPDPAGQIRELCWADPGLFFTVQIDPRTSQPLELRFLPLPPPERLAPDDPLRLAGQSKILGPGRLPRFYGGAVYFLREKGQKFDLLRRVLATEKEEVVAAGVGPYFDIGPDGTVAYLSDPESQDRPVRVTLLAPGAKAPEVTTASAYRLRFSPDGSRLLAIWVTGGAPRYYVYDRKTHEATEIASLRQDLSAKVLADLMDHPLFDW